MLSHIRHLSPVSSFSLVALVLLGVALLFTVTNSQKQEETRSRASGGGSIASLTLINSSTNSPIVTLQNGMTISLSNLPTSCLNIRANTNPTVTGSVKFGYDGNANYHTENALPYDLGGDGNGTYPACWTLTTGLHTVIATPYTSSNAQGIIGTPAIVLFNVVYSAPSPTIKPTNTPIPTITPTPQPVNTPTPTPTQQPGVTLTPTNTPIPPTTTPLPTATQSVPTPTPAPGDTQVALDISLHGIGNGGDNANPHGTGNTTPDHAQRSVTVEVFDSQNKLADTVTGSVIYNSTSGSFKGTVDLGGNIQTGAYTIKVKTDQYLRALIPGIQTLTSGQSNTLPQFSLIAGDVNNDNQLNILDYNILMGCYSDLLPATNCNSSDNLLSDLTDDGQVNQFDYNLFLRELGNSSGQ